MEFAPDSTSLRSCTKVHQTIEISLKVHHTIMLRLISNISLVDVFAVVLCKIGLVPVLGSCHSTYEHVHVGSRGTQCILCKRFEAT